MGSIDAHQFGVKTLAPIWCYGFRMAKQDDWARITLRLPPKLHAKLQAAADTSSVNAEIIDRLELSFERDNASNYPPARFALQAEQPISWDEIQAHVSAIIDSFPDPITQVSVEVVTPEIRKRQIRDAARFYAVMAGWDRMARGEDVEEGEDGLTPVQAERLRALEPVLDGRVPPGMELNVLMERVMEGEDPAIAFEEELEAYYRSGTNKLTGERPVRPGRKMKLGD